MRSGRVTPDTLVCEDGGDAWRLARRVPGLVPPKAMKAWQASVAAAQKVEAPPPPPPVRAAQAPAPRPVAARAPAAEAPAAAASSIRRHAVLALVVAVAAAGGGILGAVLVLRRAAPPAPSAAPASAPVEAAAIVEAAAAPTPDAARPVLRRPEPPEALPQQALDLLGARVSALDALRAAHREASDAFLRDGGLDASSVRTREALASRMAALDALRDRNESLRRALSGVPEQVRADAAKAGLAPEVADAAARRARRELSVELRARDADAQMHDVAGEVLGLLDDRFGAWTVADRAIAFAPGSGDDAARRYAELLADAKAIAGR